MQIARNTLEGWDVDGAHVHPPEAYTHIDYWLSHFEATFPQKAAKMHAYSELSGWSPIAHLRYWPSACIGWLNKRASHNTEVTRPAEAVPPRSD